MVPFRVISQIKYDRRLIVVLELVPLGVKNISSHAQKTGSWYLLGFFFKNSHGHPRPFYMGFPPTPGSLLNVTNFEVLQTYMFTYFAESKISTITHSFRHVGGSCPDPKRQCRFVFALTCKTPC